VARRAVNSPGYHVPIRGFSQVVLAPDGKRLAFVSGLTARTADGTIVHVGDVGGQTRQVLENLRAVLSAAGATLDDVVQIRTYVRDVSHWSRIQEVWERFWGDVWPASTLVEVRRLYDERQLIEMEAVAAVGSRNRRPAAARARPPRRAERGARR